MGVWGQLGQALTGGSSAQRKWATLGAPTLGTSLLLSGHRPLTSSCHVSSWREVAACTAQNEHPSLTLLPPGASLAGLSVDPVHGPQKAGRPFPSCRSCVATVSLEWGSPSSQPLVTSPGWASA